VTIGCVLFLDVERDIQIKICAGRNRIISRASLSSLIFNLRVGLVETWFDRTETGYGGNCREPHRVQFSGTSKSPHCDSRLSRVTIQALAALRPNFRKGRTAKIQRSSRQRHDGPEPPPPTADGTCPGLAAHLSTGTNVRLAAALPVKSAFSFRPLSRGNGFSQAHPAEPRCSEASQAGAFHFEAAWLGFGGKAGLTCVPRMRSTAKCSALSSFVSDGT
jgi:hypothetical protein